MTDQSTHTTEVQLGGQVRFIGVIYMHRGKGLLTGAGMTQKTAVSPKPNLAHKAGNLETLDSQQTAQLVET